MDDKNKQVANAYADKIVESLTSWRDAATKADSLNQQVQGVLQSQTGRPQVWRKWRRLVQQARPQAQNLLTVILGGGEQ